MKPLTTAAVAAALVFACGLGAAPARADDDCETVLKDLKEAVEIAAKNFETTMGELKQIMSEPADDKKKAKVKNVFCSAAGEVLGTSRVTRAAAAECSNQKAELDSLDKSIKEMETAIDGTCK